MEDIEIVIAAYGISARFAKLAIDQLREKGVKVGLIRPITVHPFPHSNFRDLDYMRVKAILDVEMSIPPQFIFDVAVGAGTELQ